MTTHELKILPKYFRHVVRGHKTFELRKADRDYCLGDVLRLREWDGDYTGRQAERYISYIYRGTGDYGLAEGYCILGMDTKRPELACLD